MSCLAMNVAGGKKSEGKPKMNWVDCLEEDCARANIPYGSWTENAKNPNTWQKSIVPNLCQGETGPLLLLLSCLAFYLASFFIYNDSQI
jgi:hypothetical protein